MKIKCEYCGGFINDTDAYCEHCGAANANIHRESDGVPKTVEELKNWYTGHNLPDPEVTRFFIGEDHQGPKAFGIYEKDGEFIVYKNKDDGSRSVRYRGTDEAYAVNELYLKLKERVNEEKARNTAKGQTDSSSEGSLGSTLLGGLLYGGFSLAKIAVIVFVIVIAFSLVSGLFSKSKGYYNYDGSDYYYNGSDWYEYDTASNNWYETAVDNELDDNADEYYSSSDYDGDENYSDIRDSSAYSSDWDDDSWDSDSDWSSSDSWSSDDSDWGSDW